MLNRNNDIRPRDWTDLQQLLFKECYNEEIDRFRSSFVYRGLSDESYELPTSLMRLNGDYRILEKPIMRNFKKYADASVEQGGTVWNWLSIAQHHGLPTRLLDWTFSPYVALHFATANIEKFNVDGAIWCVNFIEARQFLPKKLKEQYGKERANGSSIEILNKVCSDLDSFDSLKKKDDFVVFFEPPSIDSRIINQFALFSVLSSNDLLFNDWLNRHPNLFYRILLPKDMKWEIRDKLDQANITERIIYPGLDGLCQWLTRWYYTKK